MVEGQIFLAAFLPRQEAGFWYLLLQQSLGLGKSFPPWASNRKVGVGMGGRHRVGKIG